MVDHTVMTLLFSTFDGVAKIRYSLIILPFMNLQLTRQKSILI